MCDSIRFKSGEDVGTVRQFQDCFGVDTKLYGFDGDEKFLDCCLCYIDLDTFFAEHPELNFDHDAGEWWEVSE